MVKTRKDDVFKRSGWSPGTPDRLRRQARVCFPARPSRSLSVQGRTELRSLHQHPDLPPGERPPPAISNPTSGGWGRLSTAGGGSPNNSPESHGPYGPGERCCLRSLHGKRQLFPGSLVTRPGGARRRTWALLKARGRSRETSARATRVHRAPKAWRLLCSPGLLRAAGRKDSQVLRHGELPWTRAFLKTGAQEFNELFACRVGQNL